MSLSEQWKRRAGSIGAVVLAVGLLSACAGEYPQTIFRPVTDLGAEINDLFTLIFWITMGILVVVEVVLVWVLIRYRDRPGAPEPRKIYGNNLAEILWTLGPAIIVVIILVPTVRTIFYTYQEPPEDALLVEVVGSQWWWEFRYPEYGVVTANQLHLPVGRPVLVRLSSTDVLHNWWVPRLAGKRYNYPHAREREAPDHHRLLFTVNEPGVYSGQCAEFCGASHAIMRMNVVVEPEDEFLAWIEAMRTPVVPEPGTIEERGQQLLTTRVCVACHEIAGTTAQGRLGPSLTRFGERWTVGAGLLPNTPENIAAWIRAPADLKPAARMPGSRVEGGGMPATGLTDDEVAAIAAYLYSLR